MNERHLDVYRGTSAIVVAFAHAYAIHMLPLLGQGVVSHHVFSTLAKWAVIVFFLLSGYLITASIVSNVEKHKQFDVSIYLISRASRIFPPLVFSIFLTVAIGAFMQTTNANGSQTFYLPGDAYLVLDRYYTPFLEVASSFLLLSGITSLPNLEANAPLWSLAIEFWLYILAMFFAMSFDKRTRGTGILGVLIFLAILIWFQKTRFFMYGAIWAMGAGIALARKGIYAFFLKKVRKPALLISAVLLSTAFFYDLQLFSAIPGQGGMLYKILGITTQLSLAAFFASFIFSRKISKYANSLPGIFHKTADYSYTLYVIHYPLLFLIFAIVHPHSHELGIWINLAASALSTIIVLQAAKNIAPFLENKYFYRSLLLHRKNILPGKF